MKLNSKGLLAKFYMWPIFESRSLPVNFCDYIKGLVGRAFLVFGCGGMALFTLIMALVKLSIVMYHVISSNKMLSFSVFLSVLTTTFLAWFTTKYSKRKGIKQGRKIEILSEMKMIIGGKIDAVKKDYCPVIDWKEK